MPLDPRRAGKLTGSMVGAAIGVNEYCSRQKAWRLSTGKETFEGNDACDWGNEHEKDACLAYEIQTGNLVNDSLEEQIFYSFEDWLGITPDGRTDDLYIEFKCPWSQKIPESVPPHYMSQIQVGMEILNIDQGHLIYWTPDRLAVFEVERDKDYYAQILPLMKEFFKCMQDDVAPKRKKKPNLLIPKQGVILDERLR